TLIDTLMGKRNAWGARGDNRMRLIVSGESDVDPEELDSLTRKLRLLLLDEVDVDDVRVARGSGPTPEQAKPGELLEVGTLVVTLAPVAVRPLLRLVETWMHTRPVRTVKIELNGRSLELSRATAAQQQSLVDAFLEASSATGSCSGGEAPQTSEGSFTEQ